MNLPKRKPTRIKNYDYSQNGYYFITVCAQDKKCIFSQIVGEGSPLPQLTSNGKIVENTINRISKIYPCIAVEKYVIMPNHIHIIFCVDDNGRGNPSPTSVIDAVGWLKYSATKEINAKNNTLGKKVFQRSFHDHVMRNEEDYLKIWNYIDLNPAKWHEDKFYIEE